MMDTCMNDAKMQIWAVRCEKWDAKTHPLVTGTAASTFPDDVIYYLKANDICKIAQGLQLYDKKLYVEWQCEG